MDEYTVGINNKEYIIKVNKRKDMNNTEKKQQTSIEEDASVVCLNAIMEEYQHVVRRSEKLDNKVYILSTICGFIFAFITGIISNLSDFQMPKNRVQTNLVIIYIILVALMSLFYLYTIYKLGILLTARAIQRLTPDYLLLHKIYDIKEKYARIFIASQYVKAINDSNKILEKCFKEFNGCIYRTAFILILAFILHFLNLFITHKAI